MKRGLWIGLAMLAVGAVVAGGWALADESYSYGPGWGRGPGMMGGGYGPGMMGGGYGPGMMGGGYGPGMMGGGMMGFGMGPAFRQLPAEKQEQLRKLQVTTMQGMVAMMADMQAKSEALSDAISKFPLDQAAAKKAHEATNLAHDKMFALHLNALAQAQQIAGKEAWESLHSGGYGPGYGPGGGPGGMMGPGTRGPAR